MRKDTQISGNNNQGVYYEETGPEVILFEHAARNRLPLLLKGPTGTGKTRFVEHMATRLGKKLITVACHEETSASDLIGRYIVKGAETIWLDGPLTHAVKEGTIIYIDEIVEARPDTVVALHSLTDTRRSLFVDKLNTTIQAPPDFMLVASYNPGYQQGNWKELKPSTKQRFLAINFDYPAPDREQRIIEKESGVEAGAAGRLAKLGHAIRAMTELGLLETVSTRRLVDAARLIHSGLPPRVACQAAIVETLSDEPDITGALRDVVSLYF